jgi:hypothetical protein
MTSTGASASTLPSAASACHSDFGLFRRATVAFVRTVIRSGKAASAARQTEGGCTQPPPGNHQPPMLTAWPSRWLASSLVDELQEFGRETELLDGAPLLRLMRRFAGQMQYAAGRPAGPGQAGE